VGTALVALESGNVRFVSGDVLFTVGIVAFAGNIVALIAVLLAGEVPFGGVGDEEPG
jgi:hypothetical protein